MANFGRFVCVALPFAMTVASLIAMLVAGLAGITEKSLYVFDVDLTNFTISASDVENIVDTRSLQPRVDASSIISSVNVTAADLGLEDKYEIGLWGYCYTSTNGSRECSKPAYNWAETKLNSTQDDFKDLVTATGANITLPSDISDALSVFGGLVRWTEIVFIIALIALAVELFFGIFATCSRAFSCVTFLVSWVATVAVCAAAGLSTAVAIVVVAAVDSGAKKYGVKADFNTKFLAAVWVGAAFAIGAGLFWLFTICCCAPDHRSSRRRGGDRDEAEKFIPSGSYQPVYEDPNYAGHQARNADPQYYASNANAPRRDLAYEPYSHANV